MACKTYGKLKRRITSLYGTQENFARELNDSKRTVRGLLNGMLMFEEDTIERWAGLLKIGKGEYGEYFDI